MENNNCTVVTALYNLNRENWNDYKRKWSEYKDYFKNTLSLKSKMVIFIESELLDFVKKERAKIDPSLEHTKIIIKPFNMLPKYHLYNDIKKIMVSPEYRKGLIDPNPPEYNIPEYSVLVHSKMHLVQEAIDNNYFNTEYYMWMDGGIRHNKFKPEQKNAIYPNNDKLLNIKGIRMLCRILPTDDDLKIDKFYKSHQNRFGAGVILGNIKNITKFNSLMDEILLNAIDNNLIDSEQSMHVICYLQNKELFDLVYNTDWYYHFDYYF